MSKKEKKIDMRIPRPLTPEAQTSINTFFQGLPALTVNLYDINPDETKNFYNCSNDDRLYIDDVANTLNQPNHGILTHVTYENVNNARTAGAQNRAIANQFQKWADHFADNAMQAEAYAYQQASLFEENVDSAVVAPVQGARMIKDSLVSNRESRQRKAAATRAANAKLAENMPPKS